MASVDQLCRVAYSFFSRSTLMRKEYMKLQSYHFQQVNKVLFKSLYVNYRKCELFAIQNHVQRLLDVINSISQELSAAFIKLVDIANCLPASSAVAERFFFRYRTASRRNTATDFLWTSLTSS